MLGRVKRLAADGSQFATVLYQTLVEHRGELATGETIGRRLALCRSCPHMDADRNRCRSCGCKVKDDVSRKLLYNLANKVAHKTVTCPNGIWGMEGDTEMEAIEKQELETRIAVAKGAVEQVRLNIAKLPMRISQLQQEIARIPETKEKLEQQLHDQTVQLLKFEESLSQ